MYLMLENDNRFFFIVLGFEVVLLKREVLFLVMRENVYRKTNKTLIVWKIQRWQKTEIVCELINYENNETRKKFCLLRHLLRMLVFWEV